jgi:hypothetical protein
LTDEILLYAQEPLWDGNGSRTHEHWVQIEKIKNQYEYSYGDERGTIDSKVADNLADLLSEAYERKAYYDMEVETDTITPKHEEKEIVQFT